MGPAKDKHQTPTNILKLCVRAVIENEAMIHRRAIKEETIAIHRDVVYNQACRLTHGIHVVSYSFKTFNYLF